ncbi:hypothetical protein [Virgisporangium aliadipatigenens]|uniref:hypothetical protein n=1 Tax=Virgisporangium aliadipatigenens TaxID=741659 RepID=UPI0019414946|nr:hypothetical protein [Virgisporangium aliadipatigenens]
MAFDPAATRAWLQRPSRNNADITRAQAIGVLDDLSYNDTTYPTVVEIVLMTQPEALLLGEGIAAVLLWPVRAEHVPDDAALVTVDVKKGIRLSSRIQYLSDSGRSNRGIAAVLSGLAHIAEQACGLIADYEAANPQFRAEQTQP